MCCSWCHKAYIKILLFGAIAIAGISSIYSVLADVDILQIAPNSEYNYVIDGISCQKPGDHIAFFSEDCYEIAKQMAHNKSSNTKWQCNRYTDYSSKKIYADILVFQVLFAILIISSFMYGINACIHDCTLIHYSSLDQLDSVKFHPQKKDMIVTWTGVRLLQFCNDYLTNHCHWILRIAIMSIIIILVAIIGGIVFFLVDVIGISVMYLVLGITNKMCCCDKLKSDNYINGISYVSSSFVALSRCFIMTSSAIMIANALGIFGGFGGESIPSLDEDKCSCQCVFVLPQTNLWGFVITTSIIMITNFFFLKSWREEAYHGQYFLYLITYSLSIKIAQNLNPMNPAGDVVDKPFTSQYTLEVNKSDGLDDDDKADQSDLELYNQQGLGSQYFIDLKTTDQIKQEKEDWIHHSMGSRTASISKSKEEQSDTERLEMNTYYPLNNNQENDTKKINESDDAVDMNKKTGIAFRWLIWLYSLAFSIVFVGLTTSRLGRHNPYGYPHWICQILIVAGYGFLIISSLALIIYGVVIYRKKR